MLGRVHFELYDLESQFNSAASQLLGACSCSLVAHDRLDQHGRHYAASNLFLEPLFSALSVFLDGAVCLVDNEVTKIGAMHTTLGAAPWVTVELYFKSRLEQIRTEGGIIYLQLAWDHLGLLLEFLQLLVTIHQQVCYSSTMSPNVVVNA